MQLQRYSFVVNYRANRGREIASATEQLNTTFGALNPLISLHRENNGNSHNGDHQLFTIHLIDGRSATRNDFDFARHDRSGIIYLGSIFDSDHANPSELLRIAMLRMAVSMLDVVPLGDSHIVPHCIMQPTHSIMDLKFLAGVAIPLCGHCQDGVSSFGKNI